MVPLRLYKAKLGTGEIHLMTIAFEPRSSDLVGDLSVILQIATVQV